MASIKRMRAPSHPGKALKAMVIDLRGIQVSELADSIGMSRKTVSQILNGNARMTPVTASKIARALNISSIPWVNMQTSLDLFEAEQDLKQWKPGKVWSEEASGQV
jgi:antitoxin HigA-1